MRKIIDWTIDYLYAIKGHTLMFFRRNPPKHYLGHIVVGKNPVIIIPGVFGRWGGGVKPLADFISLQGHPVYIVPNLGINIYDIPTSAKILRELIDQEKITKAIIVGHSKGGLIGKYFLAHENGDNAVAGVVAIATPFSGSTISKLVPHRAVKEMAIDSKMIHYLNSLTDVNQKIVSIIPEFDNHVWHPKGSFLEGALANIYVETRGHHLVVGDKNVYPEVLKAIERLSRWA